MARLLHRMGMFCARRPLVMIGVWVLVAVAVFGSVAAFGSQTNNDLRLPGTGSQFALPLALHPPSARPGRKEGCMDRVRFITHKGKKVLLVDYSNITEESQLVEMIEQREFLVDSQPKNSVLMVINVSGAKFSKEVLTRAKEANVYDLPYVRRSALVGVEERQKPAIDAVSMFAKRQWENFATLAEALDWIVADEAATA